MPDLQSVLMVLQIQYPRALQFPRVRGVDRRPNMKPWCPKIELLERRLLLASDWQNPFRPRDVDRDGLVGPLDVLVGINRLNSASLGALLPYRESDSEEPFYDVDGDGRHSPLDVLVVVNSLNGGLLIDAADLKNDTGLGASANTDRLTNDPSLVGHAAGQPKSLKVRFGENRPWHDVSDRLHADGAFDLSNEILDELSGVKLLDGDLRIDLEVRDTTASSTIVDRGSVKFRLDRTRPSSNILLDITMDRPDRIVIPLSEAAVSESFNPSQVRLFDVSFGEKSTDINWGIENGFHPRFGLQPRSVELSTDGKSIIIVPPANADSIRYLVELSNVVQDRAGNVFDHGNSWQVRANFLNPNVPTLQLGTIYQNRPVFDPKNFDFKLELLNAEALLFSGDRELNRLTRFEFYDSTGMLVRTLWPRTNYPPGPTSLPPINSMPADDELGPAFKPAIISLPAGSYLSSGAPPSRRRFGC